MGFSQDVRSTNYGLPISTKILVFEQYNFVFLEIEQS